ncbi:ABC transporter permease [Bacteroides hominis]|jgi:ABC-type antimicrobial peptide transport system permease subunit|uniref:ABC transporter permease n=3 Tax=Bacteroides TaxID=816 RepID=A0A2K9GW34_BACFG|nr:MULTISPECIES: ABC transporter permease [Bacteroides]CCZ38604.1 putative uncharacterized protein [Bacteroides fragilis CAG:558]AUI45966.1 ABC transporter permease [Bacteroides fragilis]EFR52154.1 efflux ABC transporter, permease protein [Bacteroides fragilis 3_1_12]MBC5615197.1 ABC transporter permease [Bacteroides hominis (ex Liu et al. 2022)]MBE7400066.1 ABC transporter permease [Bacteroides fragilis]
MIKLYLKQSWMLIRQNKLFSSLYVLGTGLAIAMTMIIAIVYYIKIAPIYPEVNRSVTMRMKGVSAMHVKGGGNSYLCSYEMLKEWFYPLKSAELVTAVNEHFLNREGAYIQPAGGGEQIPALVKYTDPNFFRLFEFEFLNGKPFSEADLASGIRNVVLSDRMARRIFGRTDVVGQTFKLDFKESKVVGVVREGSYLLPASYGQIYMPYSCLPGYDSNNDGSHKVGTYIVYFKVRQKEDMPKLYAEVNEMVHKYNISQKEYTVDIFHQPDPYWQTWFREGNTNEIDWMSVIKLYGGALLALLLVPAINLSGMISSRMDDRLAEMGIRKAFGANRKQLLNQVLWENLLLTCIGGLMGLIVSWGLLVLGRNWVFSLFDKYPTVVSDGVDVAINPQMLFSPLMFCVTFAFCLILNLLSAWWPTWRSLHNDIIDSLNTKK